MTTALKPPDIAALTDLLFIRAADAPNALAFDVRGERITSRALLDGALRAAMTLRERGALAGTPCAITLSTSPEFLWAFFGASLIGAVPVAINPRLPLAQTERRVRELGATAVVSASSPTMNGSDRPFGGVSVVLADEIGAGRALPHREVRVPDPDGLSHLQLTSGTTGQSRAVMLQHRNVLSAIESALDGLDPSPADVMVGWLPLHHDLGLVRFVFESLYFGVPCYLLEPAMTTLPSWLHTISRVGGTITAAPDFVYRVSSRLVDPRTIDLHTLRIATNGGEAVRLSSINAFEERFAVPGVVRPGFGLAEATLGVSCVRVGEPIPVDATGAVCCGSPIKNIRLRIADAEGRDQPAGIRGRILVAGAAVSPGYLNDPESTAAILQGGWLDTGDVGAIDAIGRLYVHGRTRAMIKRAGAAIAPREIEEIVDELPGVRRSAAVGLDAGPEALTDIVCVVVEIERTVDRAGEAALSRNITDVIRRALGFAPHAIRFVKPGWIPRTASGKTQYAELKSLLASHLDSPTG